MASSVDTDADGDATVDAPPTGRRTRGRRRPARPERRTLGHQPGLDGLRGLAVTGVVLYHLGQADDIGWLRSGTAGGFLGVSAFLTLSGFLITSLLILEFESVGHISLGGFWSRRFRRLMPASLVTLAAVAILTPVVGTQSQLKSLPGEIWSALGYVFNWHAIVAGSDYAATFNGAPSPLKHFWSLAVEEQCYLILPFVVGASLRFGKGRRLLGASLTLIVALSTAATVLQSGGRYANAVYMGTHTRIGELALGGLVAVAFAGRTSVRSTTGYVICAVGGPLALGMTVAAWGTTDLQASWLYRGGFTLHAAAVGLVIVAAMQPQSAMRAILSVRPLTLLGRYSYGIYLFHWPVLWWLTEERIGLATPLSALVQLALTGALAVISYHVIEQPIRSGRLLVGPGRAIVPIAAVVAVAFLAFNLPAPDRTRLVAISASKGPVVPTTVVRSGDTKPPPPLRVMVVGDSFALSVGLGLEHWATSTGKIATLNTGLVGCGFGRGGENRGIGLERSWDAACTNREKVLLQAIDDFAPDVVLCAGGMWDVTDRKLAGTSTWTHVGEPAYDKYLAGEFAHMTDVLASGGATVVWATAPKFAPVYNPESFMGKPPYPEAAAGRSDRYNQILQVAVGTRPDARILDLAAWMRRFPGGEFSPNLRIDGVHFTEQSTDMVAAQFLGPELLHIGRDDN